MSVDRTRTDRTPADYYERIAAAYREDRFGNSYGRFIDAAERRWLDGCLSRRPDGPVLDLACGDGRFSDRADLGIDLAHGMLRIARDTQPGTIFARADATAWPLANGTLAAAFCFHLAMHLREGELRALVAEAARCLKPGGLLLIDVPSRTRRRLRPHRSDIAQWHGHSAYDADDILAMATDFTLDRIDGLLMLPLHRVPVRWRPLCAGLDRLLCRLLRPLASYQLIALRRT
jgi:SAM-dependent methyltransferase